MKHSLVYIITAIVIALELMAFSPGPTQGPDRPLHPLHPAPVMAVANDQDFNECISKVGSEWGSKIGKCAEYDGYKAKYDDTYRVDLKNTCTETLDVQICVQEEDKSWNCKTLTSIAPNVEFSHYACKGVGKYLRWTRVAGDESIFFPSTDQVNEQYPE